MIKPLVSVIMPVYNAEKYVGEAIESILGQSFTNFEFLIFNDGSADGSSEIITSYKDERIVFIDSKENFGYVKHLNDGIKLAKGKYIARMDADDISLPERFQKQVDFLEKNEDIGLCGTWYKLLGKEKEYHTLTEHNKISIHLLFNNGFGHPTMFIRKSVLIINNLEYNGKYIPAEDYELWTRVINFTKVSNIPKVLLHYRIHESQITITNTSDQTEKKNKIRLNFLKNLDITPNKEEAILHLKILNENKFKDYNSIIEADKWLDKLLLLNQKKGFFDKLLFKGRIKSIRKKMIISYFIRTSYNTKVLFELFNINNSFFLKIPFCSVCKISIKSITGWKSKN